MGCNSLANPFYVTACGIQSHQEVTVFNYFYSGAVLTAESVLIPLCNKTFSVEVSGLAKTTPGQYLWNPLYGYFKIVNFNYSTDILTLENECHTTNAAAGFSIPACTVFMVVDTPCCFNVTDYFNYPYLEVDMVVPEDGDCTTIKLTNVHSIIVGQFVVIDGGTYLVSEVLNATDVVICNEGSGGIPGSVVYAKNYSQEYIVPVTVEQQEVCDRTPETTGALTICTSTIASSILGNGLVGSVPALTDTASNKVTMMTPNQAYAQSICSQDLSTAISNFIQEYTNTSAAGVVSNPAPHDDTAQVTVYIENDTCNYCYMDVVVESDVKITAYPAASGEWANFSSVVEAEAASSPSASPSVSPSTSPSTSPSASPSATPSVSPSPSGSSPSASPSSSPSSSPSPSATPSSSPSSSPSATPSTSPSASPSLATDNVCDINVYEEVSFNHSGATYIHMQAIDWLRGRVLSPGEITAYNITLTATWEAGDLSSASFDSTQLNVTIFGNAL